MSAERTLSSPRRFSRLWAVLGVAYALFFYWYTPTGGPLTPEEIAHYETMLRARRPAGVDLEPWIEFMRSDTGDDFVMINALDLRDTPAPVPGVPAGATASEVMQRYVEPFFALAVRNAAHPVLMGAAAAPALDLWGIDGADRWDQGGLVRYRSRRDVMKQIEAIATSGEDIHQYKIAALEKTIAYPLDPWFHLGDPRLVLGLAALVLALGREASRRSPVAA